MTTLAAIGEAPPADTPPSRRAAILWSAIPAAYFIVSVLFALATFSDYGAGLPQFLRYIAAPAALAAILIGCAVLAPPRIGVQVGACFLAVLVALFAFEALMSFRLYSVLLGQVGQTSPSHQAAAASAGGLPAAHTPNSVNRELGTVRLAGALLGGIPGRRVLLCTNDRVPVFYDADRYGFNNPDSVYAAPVETMIVGDSFVEGVCQPAGQDMVSRLRTARPGTIGIGMRGGGPLTELAMIGRYGADLRPRTVVIAFFEGNDWKNLGGELKLPWLRQSLQPGADFGPTTLQPTTLARVDRIVAGLKRPQPGLREVLDRTNFARNFVALQQSGSQIGITFPKVTPHRPEYAGILLTAKQLAASWGGEVVLLYIPRTDRYLGLIQQDFVYDALRDQVLAAAAASDIEVIDLAEAFRQHPAPRTLFAPDGHFSAAGAALAARLTAERLPRPSLRTAERED